jgi:hypothetical protein
MTQVRIETKPPMVGRFPCPFRRRLRARAAVGAIITLVTFLGSLLAATLGPAAGDLLPSPLLLLLALIRG